MKTFRLIEAIGNIDDRHIRDAWSFRKIRLWKRALPLAACLVLVVGVIAILNRPIPKQPPPSGLPMLRISPDFGSMGFEGYMAYGIDDLTNGNPWREDAAPSTLPVYLNSGSNDVNGQKAEYDMEAMTGRALEVAKRLGLSEDELTVTDNRPSEREMERIKEKYAAIGDKAPPDEFFEPSEAVVKADGVIISVDARLEATIHFDPAIQLPEEYNYTHFASYEDTRAVGQYLIEKYRDLLGMKEPVLSVNGGDYTIYDEQMYFIGVYEGSGSIEEKIVSYNLSMATFGCDDNGELFIARVRAGEPARKLGDYPVITADKARELLRGGNFLTTVPAGFPGMEYVRKVELMYRGGWDIMLMPYYRFYVEIPDMTDGERKTYGAYYVPAVEEQYIENMPIWDGSFN